MSNQYLGIKKLVELSKHDKSTITIKATVITGFENLAMDECLEKCKPLNISRAKGCIYFNIPLETFSTVMSLRAVDNLFLVNEALAKIGLLKNKTEDLNMIQSLVDKVDWEDTLHTWAMLTQYDGVLFPPLNKTVNELVDGLGGMVLNEDNGNTSGEVLNQNVKFTKSEMNPLLEGMSDEILVNSPKTSDDHLSNKTQELLTSSDCTMGSATNENPLKASFELTKRKNSSSSDDSFYSLEEAEFTVENFDEAIKCSSLGEERLNTTNVMMKETIENDEVKPALENSNKKKSIESNILRFRATCNRVGEHSFTSMEAAAVFGGSLNDKFNWIVNLNNYNLNVVLNINADTCYICSAITQKSLHRRNITHFGRTTLRSTMCYNLVRLAQPTKGEVIIDPLCGGGSISIEGALGFNNTFHLCGDNDDKAIKNTAANINHIRKKQPLLIDPLKWNARRLPLKNHCVDVLVTDLPFGKRSGKKSENISLYTGVLTEMARVIRCGTGRAVLLTNDKKSIQHALIGDNTKYWRQINSFSVNQGGLFSTVFFLLRTSKPFLF